jgi:hypothetical protein
VTNTNAYNKCGFYLLSKNNLTDINWITNTPPYAVTGEVTRICFTNYAPQGFFKVSEYLGTVPTEP